MTDFEQNPIPDILFLEGERNGLHTQNHAGLVRIDSCEQLPSINDKGVMVKIVGNAHCVCHAL